MHSALPASVNTQHAYCCRLLPRLTKLQPAARAHLVQRLLPLDFALRQLLCCIRQTQAYTCPVSRRIHTSPLPTGPQRMCAGPAPAAHLPGPLGMALLRQLLEQSCQASAVQVAQAIIQHSWVQRLVGWRALDCCCKLLDSCIREVTCVQQTVRAQTQERRQLGADPLNVSGCAGRLRNCQEHVSAGAHSPSEDRLDSLALLHSCCEAVHLPPFSAQTCALCRHVAAALCTMCLIALHFAVSELSCVCAQGLVSPHTQHTRFVL